MFKKVIVPARVSVVWSGINPLTPGMLIFLQTVSQSLQVGRVVLGSRALPNSSLSIPSGSWHLSTKTV